MFEFEREDMLKCPYCDAEQYGHEPDEISANMCHTECERCGKSFWYSVTVSRTYFPYIEEDEEENTENIEDKYDEYN